MPKVCINNRTEKLLKVKKELTGLSNPELIEFAIIQMRVLPLKNKKSKRGVL